MLCALGLRTQRLGGSREAEGSRVTLDRTEVTVRWEDSIDVNPITAQCSQGHAASRSERDG